MSPIKVNHNMGYSNAEVFFLFKRALNPIAARPTMSPEKTTMMTLLVFEYSS